MKNTINLNVLIYGSYSTFKDGKYISIELTEEQKQQMVENLQNFLLSHCYNGSKFHNTFTYGFEFSRLKEHSIFSNVLFNLETNKCLYAAAQDFSYEIKYLKNKIYQML